MAYRRQRNAEPDYAFRAYAVLVDAIFLVLEAKRQAENAITGHFIEICSGHFATDTISGDELRRV